MSHLSQYAKAFKDIQIPHYQPQQQQQQQQQPQQFLDDSENASVGSVENYLEHMIAKDHPRRNQDWPWKKYLPEQYALPTKDLCEHDDPDHHCEFCGPPSPTKASYFRSYQSPLPSLLE